MNKVHVGVIDYGMGNLHSVAKALDLQGAQVTVSDARVRLKNTDLLVLPGVGRFGAAMKTLAQKKLDGFVQHWLEEDKPYLGICLGYQLLFENSEESRGVPGLGVFKGSVVRFRKPSKEKFFTIPHMGWNQAVCQNNDAKRVFHGIKPTQQFYFVHSYYPVPKDKNIIGTQTLYGKKFCSAVCRGNMFASQFHPEKSGEVGLRLLKNILRLQK